jgi:glutamate synthase domain-containing protein 2
MGPDDLGVKVEQIREATDYEVPIFIKIGAGRVYDDVKLAAKVGVEAVVIDGMEGGTAASPEIQLDHTGIPTISAVVEAAQALYDIGMKHEVKLIIGGGISNGADAAKAIALGADVVYMGSAMLIALNCQRPIYIEDYHALGTEPGACHHCHTGKCPVGIATQDPELMARLDPTAAAERVENYINSITMEMQIFARSCGKSRVSDLDPTDLRSLTLVTSYITGVPLVGLGGKKPYFASLDHGSSFKDLLKV